MPNAAYELDVQASQEDKVLASHRRLPETEPDGTSFIISADQFMLPEPEPIPGTLVIKADFTEPKTLKDLADEQRQFLATIQEPLEDVVLPPDE